MCTLLRFSVRNVARLRKAAQRVVLLSLASASAHLPPGTSLSGRHSPGTNDRQTRIVAGYQKIITPRKYACCFSIAHSYSLPRPRCLTIVNDATSSARDDNNYVRDPAPFRLSAFPAFREFPRISDVGREREKEDRKESPTQN